VIDLKLAGCRLSKAIPLSLFLSLPHTYTHSQATTSLLLFPQTGHKLSIRDVREQPASLVRRVTAIVDKIVAYPTNLTKLLISVAVEDFKVGGINESIIVSVDLVLGVWV